MKKNTPPQAPEATGAGAAVDVNPIVAKVREGLPPNLQGIYDKAVLSGMRIMFDKNSFQMTMDELKKPGPLAGRLSNGTIALVYMLWTSSKQTLPPQIIVPLTLTMTLKAFDFVQMIQDPEATKETLGEACAQAVQGVMDRFGATEDKLPELVKAGGQAPAQPGAAPAAAAAASAGAGGMLDAAMGGA